ncbi:hypothetical protein NL676_037075 [Syzygium grande]|nr:hypothetical protein NL676_037075 [Syzygium grande]
MALITLDSTGLNGPCQLKNLPISRNLQVKYPSPFVNRHRLHYWITYIPLAAYSSWTQTTLVGTAPFFLEKLVKRTDGDVAQSVS